MNSRSGEGIVDWERIKFVFAQNNGGNGIINML